MNQRYIGIIVLVIGVILASVVGVIKYKEDKLLDAIIEQEGTCFLDDGTCLHGDRNLSFYIFGWILAGGLILLGGYLVFFDKTQQTLFKQNEEVAKSLVEAKNKDEFSAFISAFGEQEQKVLKVLHNEEGILQSTLRYRVEMSKAKLSVLLKNLEEKGVVARKEEGKSYKLFLKKKW